MPPFWAHVGNRTTVYPHATSVIVTPPVLEPLTLAEAKLWAGFDWAAGDAREPLLSSAIVAARSKVEHDTGLALLTQTRDVYFDALPGSIVSLPAQSQPLQSVTTIKSTDSAGAVQTLAADQYHVDVASGRVGLSLVGSWPSDVRSFQPFVIRLVSGWTSVALLPPLLLRAVGLLTAHYATAGRDLVIVGTIVAEMPQGYEDCIAPYRLVSLA